MGRKKYNNNEERLAARREREREQRQRRRDDHVNKQPARPSARQPHIQVKAKSVIARWRALQEQHDLENDTAVATFLMDR